MRKFWCNSNDQFCEKQLHWFYGIIFVIFWLLLYWAIAASQINHLPKALSLIDERMDEDRFIGERAVQILYNLTNIGPRVVGSQSNEVETVDYLIKEIRKIQRIANKNIVLEWNVQEATGSYIHWTMLNMYQSIQNVVVRLRNKDSISHNYVLLNSHYDTVPNSPGAGDDGSMVAVMLEVLRILATSSMYIKHPIIFLFNGAEENPLQASHAFITQHKWAKNCKCFINLDSAGNGGRELVFQSGPENPWLMHYYRRVPHPFANTMAEEMFQAGLIPSDTDFRIFRDYGHIPGLDMAYIFNGYVYHTKYDRISNVTNNIAASLQRTGDNVLTLTKLLSNSIELDDPQSIKTDGYVIFYDFLGLFMIFYTASTGTFINITISLITFSIIILYLHIMSFEYQLHWKMILFEFSITFIIHIFSIIIAITFTLTIACFMDAINNSMSWFASKWLILGIYICPMLFGMAIGPIYYIKHSKSEGLTQLSRSQLFIHSHCILLIMITIVLSCIGVRSAFVFMIAVFFQLLTLIINLLSKKFFYSVRNFAIIEIICQIIPFIYYTSIAHLIYATLIPMTGRNGTSHNPDLFIAGIAICCCILFAGFILPILIVFNRIYIIINGFLFITGAFIIMAISFIGFPYRSELASQRWHFLHAQRIMYNLDKSVQFMEYGVYIYPQDRHFNTINEHLNVLGNVHRVSDYCNENIFCGMPLFNHRWHNDREQSFWIPIEEKPQIPLLRPKLNLLSEERFEYINKTMKRYEFSLTGPDHMTIFIGVKNNAEIIDWSLNKALLMMKVSPPYFIYFSYGKNNAALNFTIDVQMLLNTNSNNAVLEISIVGHWIHQNLNRSKNFDAFINNLPDWIHATDWVASYENYLF